jgi:hypothetical protein
MTRCSTKNNDLVVHVKMAWARVLKLVKISDYLVEALLKGSNQTWDIHAIFMDM